jgi:hypothetical protein
LPVLAFGGATGCTPTPGVLGPTGFDQRLFGYHVAYTNPRGRSFLGPDWRVDNFTWDGPTQEWTPKDGPNYEAIRELDEDDDGKISADEKHKEPIYDLRLTHVHDHGVLWIKAHPLTVRDSQRDLDVEIADYADSLAGRGAFYQGSVFSLEHVKTREYTTFVTDKSAAAVAGLSGTIATVEVAESSRLQLDPAYRSAKIRVCMAKITYIVPKSNGPQPPRSHWPVVSCEKDNMRWCERAVGLLVIGYVNEADRFEAHLADYNTFLSEITLAAVKPLSTLLRDRTIGAY